MQGNRERLPCAVQEKMTQLGMAAALRLNFKTTSGKMLMSSLPDRTLSFGMGEWLKFEARQH